MIKRASMGGCQSDTDMLAGAGEKPSANSRPLFLRHVVGGNFKYRWLVLGLSAFTSMTIIVVVSVVYSNR